MDKNNLKPGDIVRVKSFEEIQASHSTLAFAPSMEAYCGNLFVVVDTKETFVLSKPAIKLDYCDPGKEAYNGREYKEVGHWLWDEDKWLIPVRLSKIEVSSDDLSALLET
ncbi:MAG: hypothetical protein II670_08145 [Alphaproteobacteria bacterium]|nr:hypothetical protein [Alphaproteobacteria bacterium]